MILDDRIVEENSIDLKCIWSCTPVTPWEAEEDCDQASLGNTMRPCLRDKEQSIDCLVILERSLCKTTGLFAYFLFPKLL